MSRPIKKETWYVFDGDNIQELDAVVEMVKKILSSEEKTTQEETKNG